LSRDRPRPIPTDTAEAKVDYDILPSLVGYNLRRAQIAVFAKFATAVAKHQVTPGQFGVLTLISANPGLTQSALAKAVGIERSTMVAVIDGLQRSGLVERRPSPIDRRSYALALTAAGRKQTETLKSLVIYHEDRLLSDFSDRERATLITLLQHLVGNC
jgi:DNA-binding MarR family transcriptional regulator